MPVVIPQPLSSRSPDLTQQSLSCAEDSREYSGNVKEVLSKNETQTDSPTGVEHVRLGPAGQSGQKGQEEQVKITP
jgi:hypothetical protein